MAPHTLPPGPGPFSRTVVTVGNFDGVHLGHRVILGRVCQRARELDCQPVAFTFDPHPAKVLNPDSNLRLLTTPAQKIALLEGAGVAVVVQPFTREFAAIPAQEFVREYFVNRLQAREVVVGHDYRFGYRREGSIALLKEMGQALGFSVQVVWAVEVDDAVVSSSLIRAMLRLGNVKEANRLLGRTYGVAGRVVAGKGRGGKLLGVPTANLAPENDLLARIGHLCGVGGERRGETPRGGQHRHLSHLRQPGSEPGSAPDRLYRRPVRGGPAGGVCGPSAGGAAFPLHRRAGRADPGRHRPGPAGSGGISDQ
jgi:riboflavin kinase/FMN adenylyltransferase